jgi:hypothetical protein
MIVCVVLAGIGAGCSAPASTRPPVSKSATARPDALAGWRSFPRYRDAVPVLTYHGIGGNPSHVTVSHAQFMAEMAALAAGHFHTLTMAQYLRFVRGDTKGLPSRPILLTFDDGRQDAYLAADPILRSYHFHAVEFVVPGWVTTHPGFSLSWVQIRTMNASGTWNVEEHFGYGPEYVPVNAAGSHGGVFGDLAYQPGPNGTAGQLESFAQFRSQLAQNMLRGEAKLRDHLPSFRPVAMGLPQGAYGQGASNSPLIAPFVLAWMHRHFGVVFGGDYLAGTLNEAHRVPGRFSREMSYRLTMGPLETLPVLRCRLLAWIRNRPLGGEYHCLHLAGPGGAQAVNALP